MSEGRERKNGEGHHVETRVGDDAKGGTIGIPARSFQKTDGLCLCVKESQALP